MLSLGQNSWQKAPRWLGRCAGAAVPIASPLALLLYTTFLSLPSHISLPKNHLTFGYERRVSCLWSRQAASCSAEAGYMARAATPVGPRGIRYRIPLLKQAACSIRTSSKNGARSRPRR
ncbi:hypothetical protein FA95DRAFT_618306 [Auriscalpium vulgare]|uniref:Uncharacterized protein n=1 Tax=Auriscalpium vulgare TaxID=40419 RepID=A0ACB8RDJ6_9AGAM|nr:hypothetical protein FA95DRAFT_618306 [Auriscalpium vulgare]